MKSTLKTLCWLGIGLLCLSGCTSQAPSPSPTGRGSSTPAAPLTACQIHIGLSRYPLTGRIAFAATGNDWDIFVMKADGSERRQLTHDPGPQFDPSWSPDGMRIAYRDSRFGINHNDEIYVMKADGSGQINPTRNPANEWSPAWSPDGKKIAFASDREGLPKIYLMNPDGTSLVRLTQVEGEYPSWSPDGKKIAFASSRDGNYEIYTMNADGSNQTRLTNNPAYDMYPAWSPDAHFIAFDTQRDYYPPRDQGAGEEFEIHVMKADGTCDTRLTTNAVEDRFPAWSSDGTRLTWEQEGQVAVMNANGTGQMTLGPGNFPAWTS